MQGEQLLSDAINFPKQLKKKQTSLPLSDNDVIIATSTGKNYFSLML